MKVFYDAAQRLHDPQFFLSSGAQYPCPEKPSRIDALLGAVNRLGLPMHAPTDQGLDPVRKVHPDRYLTFLENIYTRWSRIEEASAEVIPNIHPNSFSDGYPKSAVGQAGFHMTDTSCPIGSQTWAASLASAQSALGAADAVLAGDRAAYALCRPPGHHAFAERAGGFCYLNNSAIAAERLRESFDRVAVLDVDLHHGNGTQGVFYARGDVLTVSIHAHPERFYPFFWGYEGERGEAAGEGANLNLPLPRGTGDDGFRAALATGLRAISDFGAGAVVLALGLDAYEGDPFGGLSVTTPGFGRISDDIRALGLPTVIVQEGGYLCPELGDNLAAVLSRWL
jgi:acetoin utilization deacetylase AcuC-like enzyme